MSGWVLDCRGSARRALRRLLGDALAILALGAVLALLWFFGGLS